MSVYILEFLFSRLLPTLWRHIFGVYEFVSNRGIQFWKLLATFQPRLTSSKRGRRPAWVPLGALVKEPPCTSSVGAWGPYGGSPDLSPRITNLLQICFSFQDKRFNCYPVYFTPDFWSPSFRVSNFNHIDFQSYVFILDPSIFLNFNFHPSHIFFLHLHFTPISVWEAHYLKFQIHLYPLNFFILASHLTIIMPLYFKIVNTIICHLGPNQSEKCI